LRPSEILEIEDLGVVDGKVLIRIPGGSAEALQSTELDKPLTGRDVCGGVDLVGKLQIVPAFLG